MQTFQLFNSNLHIPHSQAPSNWPQVLRAQFYAYQFTKLHSQQLTEVFLPSIQNIVEISSFASYFKDDNLSSIHLCLHTSP
jgi:hypothetical protein